MIVYKTCILCKKEHELDIPDDSYLKWKSGVLIQNAMPEVSKEDRELLISGICGPCFDGIFEKGA